MAKRSGKLSASVLGTSSPTMIEASAISSVTSTKLILPAASWMNRSGMSPPRSASDPDSATAPTADARKPRKVIAIWIVARNRLGILGQALGHARGAAPLADQLVEAVALDGDQRDLAGGEEATHHDQRQDDGEVHERVPGGSAAGGIRHRWCGFRAAGSDAPRRHADHRLAGGHVAGHDRSGAGAGARPDADRRAEHGVDPDECPVADRGAVLGGPVEVGGDRPGADVHASPRSASPR